MTDATLSDLQASVQDRHAFRNLSDFVALCSTYLEYIETTQPTRIVSPTHHNYIFYQYDETYYHRITRPLNIDLFIEQTQAFRASFDRFSAFLDDLKHYQNAVFNRPGNIQFIQSNEVNKVIYIIQQSIGSIGDSFDNPNQSRKRIGQLFEHLVRLVIQQIGFECQPRTINIPIPAYAG
jgi:hypothetical protein